MKLLDTLHRWTGGLIGLVLALLGLSGTILLAAALCTVALVSPSLRTGWILDDIWHRAGHTRAEALRPYLGGLERLAAE